VFRFAQEFDHGRVPVIEEETRACIKSGYRLHIRSVEFEAEDVEVLRHSLLTNGLWNNDDVPLRQPSEDDLRDAFAVLSTDGRQGFVVKDIVLKRTDRVRLAICAILITRRLSKLASAGETTDDGVRPAICVLTWHN
jgi:hypothetical protein